MWLLLWLSNSEFSFLFVEGKLDSCCIDVELLEIELSSARIIVEFTKTADDEGINVDVVCEFTGETMMKQQQMSIGIVKRNLYVWLSNNDLLWAPDFAGLILAAIAATVAVILVSEQTE